VPRNQRARINIPTYPKYDNKGYKINRKVNNENLSLENNLKKMKVIRGSAETAIYAI
jgi:hypothetical protein